MLWYSRMIPSATDLNMPSASCGGLLATSLSSASRDSRSLPSGAKGSRFYNCRDLWVDGVIPFAVEVVPRDVDGVDLGVGDSELGLVCGRVQAGVDLQPGAGRGRGYQVDHDLIAGQGLRTPVDRDVAEQAVLDFVPLRGPSRKMKHPDRGADLVGELLQLGLPEPDARAVGPAGVRGDCQRVSVRVARVAEVLPPAADRAHRELAGVGADPDADPPLVSADGGDTVRDGLPDLFVGEVVGVDLHRLTAAGELTAAVLVVADQLLLLRIYRQNGLIRGERGAGHGCDVLKLRVAVGMIGALPRLAVGLQAVAQRLDRKST